MDYREVIGTLIKLLGGGGMANKPDQGLKIENSPLVRSVVSKQLKQDFRISFEVYGSEYFCSGLEWLNFSPVDGLLLDLSLPESIVRSSCNSKINASSGFVHFP